jgi:transposase-like protein
MNKKIILPIYNWLRWHLLGGNPLCPKCESEMIKKGYPKDFHQAFKCLECGYGAK